MYRRIDAAGGDQCHGNDRIATVRFYFTIDCWLFLFVPLMDENGGALFNRPIVACHQLIIYPKNV